MRECGRPSSGLQGFWALFTCKSRMALNVRMYIPERRRSRSSCDHYKSVRPLCCGEKLFLLISVGRQREGLLVSCSRYRYSPDLLHYVPQAELKLFWDECQLIEVKISFMFRTIEIALSRRSIFLSSTTWVWVSDDRIFIFVTHS